MNVFLQVINREELKIAYISRKLFSRSDSVDVHITWRPIRPTGYAMSFKNSIPIHLTKYINNSMEQSQWGAHYSLETQIPT